MSTINNRSTKNGYDGLAKRYLETKTAPWRKVIENYNIGQMLDEIKERGSILDLGCGSGFYSHFFKEKGFEKIHGVDLSDDQISEAIKLAGDVATFEQGNAINYVPKQEFDVVAGIWLLNYAATYQELVAMCKTIALCLRNGGWFIGINDNPNNQANGQLYEKYGFTREQVNPLTPGSEVWWHFLPTSPSGQPFHICCYWWSEQTYLKAFKEAVLTAILTYPLLAPEVKERLFWSNFLNDPPLVCFKAQKRLNN